MVTDTASRDVRPESVALMIYQLTAWRSKINELCQLYGQSSKYIHHQRLVSKEEDENLQKSVDIVKQRVIVSVLYILLL